MKLFLPTMQTVLVDKTTNTKAPFNMTVFNIAGENR